MKLLEIVEMPNQSPRTYVFRIQADEDIFADVSCNTETGIFLALEHSDGGIFYNHAGTNVPSPILEDELFAFVKRYTIKCTDIKSGTPVVFLVKSSEGCRHPSYMDGTTDVMAAHVNKVGVSWLEGYKNRSEFVPFADVVAAYDESGFDMRFDNISGTSLIAIQ